MKLCIVGGGSSGWMAATTFRDYDVTLVESPNIPISGVGESTLAQIQGWINFVNIFDNKKDELDFIIETNATFKQSIKFTNFLKKDSGSFHYPFGETSIDPFVWWSNKLINKNIFCNQYAEDINPLALSSERGKFECNSIYSYHFDAIKFGQFLKKRYCKNIKHILGEVVSYSGNSIRLDNGKKIEADLFIDCTGFKSLLLGKFLEEPFIPYDHLLPNDSAWTTHIPYNNKEREMVAYTENTAIDNGWVWKIPLWDKIGTGYVYSSKHVNRENAKKEFVNYLGRNDCDFKHISMRVGRHKRTWVNNVVAIGLSAGFIEPLESNGLFTVHENLIALYKTIRRGKPSQLLKDYYNKQTSLIFDEFADFVSLHYALTQREDTLYWRDNFNRNYNLDNVSHQTRYGLLAFSTEIHKFSTYSYLDKGFHYIASGMNICPYNKISNIDEIKKSMERSLEFKSHVDRLPSLYRFMKENIYDKTVK